MQITQFTMGCRGLRKLPVLFLPLLLACYFGFYFISGGGQGGRNTNYTAQPVDDARSDWLLELHNNLEERRIPFQRRWPDDYVQDKTLALKRLRRHLANMRFLQTSADDATMQGLILSDLELLESEEEFEYRSRQISDLGNLVQRRLSYLQNPENCSNAKTLECELASICGLGCLLHHLSYCLIVAYGTERTLILTKPKFHYKKGDWTNVFQPLSDICTESMGKSKSEWPGKEDTQTLILTIKRSLFQYTPYSPLPMPQDLFESIDSFHNLPVAWWVGQILRYILRPQKDIKMLYEESIKKLNFTRPIVGVQIRRTDKLKNEAKFHNLTEYMASVQNYYDMLAVKHIVDKRRIFVATDDASVFTELRMKYPEYEVIGDENIAKLASDNRYSSESFDGILRDIVLLALADHIVCTFSSNVCRLSYELMQTLHADASGKAISLDRPYLYSSKKARKLCEAVLPHKAQNNKEIDLEIGDLIIISKEGGFISEGKNTRTNKRGKYPTFKTVYHQETTVFPTYSHVS